MEKEYNFQKLTPRKDVDLKIYKTALDFVFANDDLNNIGITGPYGAGKSSVIETYKSLHQSKKFVNISLAHFSDEEQEVLDADTKKNYVNILEAKILNQLLHLIDSKNILQTNFRVKRNASITDVLKITFLFVAFIVCYVYVQFFYKWANFVKVLEWEWIKGLLLFTTYSTSRLIALGIGVVLFGGGVYGIIKLQKNHNILRKLDLQGNVIEICAQNDDSFFDKYLNEVLYLFDSSRIEVFIFEDLDRYNANQIFQRLREINILVNASRKNRNLTPIKFFYLIKDDIFVSKERTKFFDFVIPIVPVIDSSNSYEQFTGIFEKGGINHLFDQHFLQDISLYVDDMRILLNIYNEYIVYSDHIKPIILDPNKLLALIIYKNIFPGDFSNLQLNRGFVYTLFAKKEEFVSQLIESHEKKLLELKSLSQQIEMERLRTLNELDVIYCTTELYSLRINGKGPSNFDTMERFMQALKDNPKNVVKIDRYGHSSSYDFERELEKHRKNAEYTERKKLIELSTEEKTEQMNKQIYELQGKIEIIKKKRLRDVISKEDIDIIGQKQEFSTIISNPYFALIKYMIRHGYLDETYQDYMTYFYENSLSRTDQIFLRKVADEEALPYNYELNKPEYVFTRLREEIFDREESLNISLINYLLVADRTERVKRCLNRVFEQIKKKERQAFVDRFWNEGGNKQQLVIQLNNFYLTDFWMFLNSYGGSEEMQQEYLLLSIYYTDDYVLEKINGPNYIIREYIADNEKFLIIDNPRIDRICQVMHLWKVKFRKLNFEKSNKQLLDRIYQENLYELNFYMLCQVLKHIYVIPESDDFKHRSLTLIISKSEEPLNKYIRDNLEEYVNLLIDHCDGTVTDSEEAALLILNDEAVGSTIKTTYLKNLITKVTSIELVRDKSFWMNLLEYDKILPTAHNILEYYKNSVGGLDLSLIRFINLQKLHIEFDSVAISEYLDVWETFSLEFVEENSILDFHYHNILAQSQVKVEKLTCTSLSEEKVKILIELNILTMSKENLSIIRETYPECLLNFIQSNISEYVKIIDNTTFVEKELLQILKLEVDDSYKIHLLKLSNITISVQDVKCGEQLREYIWHNHFDLVDLEMICYKYNQYNSLTKEVILYLVIDNIDTVLENRYLLQNELFDRILLSEKLLLKQKQELFILHLPDMSMDQCRVGLKKLGYVNIDKLFDQMTTKINKSDFSKRLLQIFLEKKWIIKYDEEKDGTAYRVVRKVKSKKGRLSNVELLKK